MVEFWRTPSGTILRCREKADPTLQMEAMILPARPRRCQAILDDRGESARTFVFHFHIISLLESVLPFVVLERTELHGALRVEDDIQNKVAQMMKHCVWEQGIERELTYIKSKASWYFGRMTSPMESVEETRFLGSSASRSLQSEVRHGEGSSQVLLFFSLDDNLVLGFQDCNKGTQQLAVSPRKRTHSILHKLD